METCRCAIAACIVAGIGSMSCSTVRTPADGLVADVADAPTDVPTEVVAELPSDVTADTTSEIPTACLTAPTGHVFPISGVCHEPDPQQAKTLCVGCHGAGLTGGTGNPAPPSCFSCHGQLWQ